MTSINVTIHNKAQLLPLFLSRLAANTVGEVEYVFVLDGCTDDSEPIVRAFAGRHPAVTILTAPNVFETKANNIAAKASKGDYIIIVQDDVIINEYGWNDRLIEPMIYFSDVFAVTGNTAHNWAINPHSVDIQKNEIRNDRWCDILQHVHHANKAKGQARNMFEVRDCVNRAPLAIDLADLEKMGYFDEAFSPQDMDDHDLCLRAKKQLGKVVGSYWIDWWSRPEWGGTRDEAGTTKPWLFEAHHKNTRLFYERHRNVIHNQTIESRKIL